MGNKGLATGLAGLDNIINFPKAGVLLVATKPGVGKTMMMTQMAIESAKIGNKVGFVSFETSIDSMIYRILSHYSNRDLRKECSDENEKLFYKKFESECLAVEKEKGCDILLKNIIFFQVSNIIDKLLLSSKEAVNKFGVNIIFIDYLQLINFNGIEPYAGFRQNMDAIKNFALDNNILIVFGCQLIKNNEIWACIKDKTDTIIIIENTLRDKEKGELKISVTKNKDKDAIEEIDCDVNYGTGRLYGYALAGLRELSRVPEKNKNI